DPAQPVRRLLEIEQVAAERGTGGGDHLQRLDRALADGGAGFFLQRGGGLVRLLRQRGDRIRVDGRRRHVRVQPDPLGGGGVERDAGREHVGDLRIGPEPFQYAALGRAEHAGDFARRGHHGGGRVGGR